LVFFTDLVTELDATDFVTDPEDDLCGDANDCSLEDMVVRVVLGCLTLLDDEAGVLRVFLEILVGSVRTDRDESRLVLP
jgi:hypothetical protein